MYLIILPIKTFAVDNSLILESDISLDISPENPDPYGDVTISLSSYAFDINKSMIEWKNNNKTVLSGYGKTSYSFKNLGPDIGITFNINITPVGSGSTITKSVTIKPQEVDLLFESVDGYTPPFYRGKSFVASEGTVRVVAIPNSKTLGSSRNRVTYRWKAGDDTNLSASGYNKDSYVFKNNNLNLSEKVSVQASSLDDGYNATNSITIPIISPKLIFYKKSPTEGVLYNQALTGETAIAEDEETIVAEPYFLSTKGSESSIDYKWQINNEDVNTPDTPNELAIHPTARGGYATLDLIIENANLIFQKISGELKLSL